MYSLTCLEFFFCVLDSSVYTWSRSGYDVILSLPDIAIQSQLALLEKVRAFKWYTCRLACSVYTKKERPFLVSAYSESISLSCHAVIQFIVKRLEKTERARAWARMAGLYYNGDLPLIITSNVVSWRAWKSEEEKTDQLSIHTFVLYTHTVCVYM